MGFVYEVWNVLFCIDGVGREVEETGMKEYLPAGVEIFNTTSLKASANEIVIS